MAFFMAAPIKGRWHSPFVKARLDQMRIWPGLSRGPAIDLTILEKWTALADFVPGSDGESQLKGRLLGKIMAIG
jgi:hypothetical protein